MASGGGNLTEGIFANLAPIKVPGTRSYSTVYQEQLFESKQVFQCSGYVATDALVELRALLEQCNLLERFDFCIGMARFDGLTRDQITAVDALNQYLVDSGIGGVFVSVSMPVHAKVALFLGDKRSVLLGSSNLSSLTRATRQYEVDVLIKDDELLEDEIDSFFTLLANSSMPWLEVVSGIPLIAAGTHPLVNLAGVERCEARSIFREEVLLEFEIPIKTERKSGPNVFFGKGRESKNGRIIKRPWYEVEFIVPKSITTLPGYPTEQAFPDGFRVVTDDGFSFECLSSGDYSKNLRSKGDLETLGRWLKGRLEQAGSLDPGEYVTETVLQKYGRNTVTLRFTKSQQWTLDLSASV